MGRFLNPDNGGFKRSLNSKIYVDKTGLIELTNELIGTEQAFVCNSRPRRFGKSMAANMLTAYYSKGCNSMEMFQGLEISTYADFEKHLNKYDVIRFDVQSCIGNTGDPEKVVEYVTRETLSELQTQYPGCISEDTRTLSEAMARFNVATGNKFIVIIDEWDVLIRDDANNLKVQKEYIDFLRSLFKGTEATEYIALAYMTGILPIKRDKAQSALNNFREYTMLNPGFMTEYMGFTKEEVIKLCTEHKCDFEIVKRWYDGYVLKGYHVYNPNSVINFMFDKEPQSYWSETSTFEVIKDLISYDFDGLKAAIITMLSGEMFPVRTSSFQNDMASFKNKNDIMTALIHLGYLAYDRYNGMAYIPNEEIRESFDDAVTETGWDEFISFRNESAELVRAVMELNADTVAEKMGVIHSQYTSVIEYNDENSLSCVLTVAFLSSLRDYFKPVRELPAGNGFADFVYIPRRKGRPALVIELKWNKDAETALQQIKDKNYPESLKQYTGDILLVGISYDKKTKQHECVIENLEK